MSRPNVLLLVGEDTGRLLGCYGCRDVRTPNLDRLAAQGCRFDQAYTTCAVCSPSRSSIVTGQYPIKIGTHHHRSRLLHPPRVFTHELRDAGYYVSWPTKLDFNFIPTEGWRDDDQLWIDRLRAGRMPGKPWLAYMNIGVTHESSMWADADKYEPYGGRLGMAFFESDRDRPPRITDPAKVTVPPYVPDTPVVRNDIARHADNIADLDRRVGDILAALDASGLADRTVVLFLADHGRALPREKRWPYTAGLHMPLLIRWPGVLKPGSVDDRLISWVDIAPTLLSIAGAPIPAAYDGQAFLGPAATAPPRRYVFAGRDRIDEGFDRMRAVRDRRWHYLRNFFPQIPYCQRTRYGEYMPSMRELRRLQSQGRLHGEAALFMQRRKPDEELYDLERDPHCVHNLADDPALADVRQRLRDTLDAFLAQVHDLGARPERELVREGLLSPDSLAHCRTRVAPLPPEYQKDYPPTVVEEADLNPAANA